MVNSAISVIAPAVQTILNMKKKGREQSNHVWKEIPLHFDLKLVKPLRVVKREGIIKVVIAEDLDV